LSWGGELTHDARQLIAYLPRSEDFEVGAEARSLTPDRTCLSAAQLDADRSVGFGRPDRHACPENPSQKPHDLRRCPGPDVQRCTPLIDVVGD